MEIITLQEYTDQYVSLYEGEIRNLPNDLALRLINKGVAAQHDKDILNSTTSDDNGKVLTVVNGKPAFSVPTTSEVNMNYSVFYAKEETIQVEGQTYDINFLYKDKQFTTYLMPEQVVQAFEEKDFIIVKYEIFNQDQPSFWVNIFIINCETDSMMNQVSLTDGTRYFYPYYGHTEVETDPSQEK